MFTSKEDKTSRKSTDLGLGQDKASNHFSMKKEQTNKIQVLNYEFGPCRGDNAAFVSSLHSLHIR